MNVSIVIPNYNGESLLKNNIPKVIESISSYKDGFIELIVTDDASRDKSVEVLNTFAEKLNKEKSKIKFKIVKSPFNINSGFSINVNRGVEKATGDLLLLLNSDVIPHKNFIDALLPHFNDEKMFGVGCLDESVEVNNSVVLRGRGKGEWKKGFLIHSKLDVNGKTTFWISGGSSIFRKSIWDKIGGLDNIYSPFYWEDIDLSYRAQKAGYQIVFEPKSRVIHEHEKGTIKSSSMAKKVTTTAYRNQFFFVWLNITDFNLILSHMIWLPYHLLVAIKNKNIEFLTGFWWAVKELPKALNERMKNKKIFIKSDHEILKQYESL